MVADFPPSSRNTRLTVAEASCITRRPVAVEPVKETTSTRGSDASSSPTRPRSLEVSTLSTPAGMSVCSAAMRPMKVADHGVSGAALRITVQPAARAGITFATLMWNGMFHGVIAAATPAASRHSSRLLGTPMWRVTGSSSSQR